MNTPDQEKTAQRLLQLFFQAPVVNALLVFEDSEYLGIIFKKDIEMGIRENRFDLELNINFIDASEVRDILVPPEKHNDQTRIPVIDKDGHLIRIISFVEFESQFYFSHFLDHFTLEHLWDYMDHPLIVTNYFKKVLYLNKEAFLMAGKDLLGTRLNHFLSLYSMEIQNDRMILTRYDKMYQLLIHHSRNEHFDYQIYQFLEI